MHYSTETYNKLKINYNHENKKNPMDARRHPYLRRNNIHFMYERG